MLNSVWCDRIPLEKLPVEGVSSDKRMFQLKQEDGGN